MKKIRLGVLSRLLILFLVTLVPLAWAGAWIVLSANRKLGDEILKSMQQSVENFASQFDDQMAKINDATMSVVAQSRVEKLARINVNENYETYTNINIMREFLSNVQNAYPIIENIRVYLPRLDKAYNADGYAKGSIQDLTDDEFLRLMTLMDQGSQLIYQDNRLITLNSLTFRNPKSIIEVEYNLGSVSRLLASPLIYKDSYYLFYLKDNQFMISNLAQAQLDGLQPMIDDNFRDVSRIRLATEGRPAMADYYIFHAYSPTVGGTYIQLIPQKQLMQPSIFSTRYVLILIFLMLLGMLAFIYGAIQLIHKPLHKLMLAFKELGEDKNFNIRVTNAESPDFSYLYTAFNLMAEQLSTLIYRDYYQRVLLQEASFKQLQAQINPHFLYNSYFILFRMIKSGQHEESKIVAKELGNYFQYITRSHSDTVTLKDEYDHAKIYSNIQAMRFGSRITVDFPDLPDTFSQYVVPKLVLQPIVENAFNYGLENKVSGGLLRVSFEGIPEGLVISIDDNGESLSDEILSRIQSSFLDPDFDTMKAEVTGLTNIYKRLQIYYKRDDVMTASRSELGGMCVRVFIYKHEAEVLSNVSAVDRR